MKWRASGTEEMRRVTLTAWKGFFSLRFDICDWQFWKSDASDVLWKRPAVKRVYINRVHINPPTLIINAGKCISSVNDG